ncbi:MAG: VCBS repeat-containing protein [Pirellulaceae bacterium]|nr:VCBS repeat-containing protein [Pirellulaceae bacterium]
MTACGRPDGPSGIAPPQELSDSVDIEGLRPRVTAFCGDCHAFPPPDSFPRHAWHAEVEQGFNFYRESGRHDLQPPPMNEVVAWYRAQAPESLDVPDPEPVQPGPLAFRPRPVPFTGGDFPAVSHLHWQPASDGRAGELLVCDMRAAVVLQASRLCDRPELTRLAEIPHPAHITPVDLDRDGVTDYLVADLGSYQPEDHQRGRVVWLRPTTGDAKAGDSEDSGDGWQQVVLADQLGRVADIQVADFNADGLLDLIVAEFGWRKTGRLQMLWGQLPVDAVPRFRPEAIDPRHGVIHVPVCDLNHDQRPDFVGLVSQEHEVIDLFLNQAAGGFEKIRLYTGHEPAMGSSGIQMVDLDGDGDLDILYTNGDTLDSYFVKPSHAVHWLENLGDLKFQDHELVKLPGAYRALAGDLDGDGDLDIAACSYIPRTMIHDLPPERRFDSLIWLEQHSPGQFVRHALEQSPHGHMALELGDFDGDGDLDLATGSYGSQPPQDPQWLTVWENLGQPAPQ